MKYPSFNKVEKALPKSPIKSTEIVKILVKKFALRIHMKLNGQEKKILNQEEKVYLLDFLNRCDMTYPGIKDVFYLGKSNEVSQYETKCYLFLSLHESLNIVITSQVRFKSLTFLFKATPT